MAPSNVKMPLYVKRQLHCKCEKNINAKCENSRYLYKITLNVTKLGSLLRCIKHLNFKCIKIDAIFFVIVHA